MAHKKAGGSKARQGGNVAGKRLGFKVYGGEVIKNGQIILRQKGSSFHQGDNVGRGRDHTLYAKADGIVNVKTKHGKRYIEVTPKKG